MNHDVATKDERGWPHAAGAIGLAALFIWFATWTGPGQPGATADALWVIASSLPVVMAWMAAALGYGWFVRIALAGGAKDGLVIQLASGVAALMWIDAACGAAGLLQVGASFGAWMVIVIGVLGLAMQVARVIKGGASIQTPHWLMWTAAPSCAVLMVAVCSAPGVLWATEFGGYDALSYHLQLPKEWLAIGRIQPLEHNVYSFLPGYAEAAYYHLAVLKGDAIAAAYACQLLHAAVTLLTAFIIARVASRMWNRLIGVVAAVLFLGTPWIIVTGSLAYNEMFTMLMLAAGLAVINDEGVSPLRRGWLAGILGAAACGAKLTSAGMVVAPLIAAMALMHSPRQWLRMFASMFVSGMLVLLPYFLRNFMHAGNPVFPFATEVLGAAHWTAEQVAIWHQGHIADMPFAARLTELWNQFLRFGLGPHPYPASEPWKPQWSILPWLGIAGMIASFTIRRPRRNALVAPVMLMVQLAFWICLTHLKSRFLLPTALPMIVLVCDAMNLLSRRLRGRITMIVTVLGLLIWSAQPAMIFRSEAGGAPALGIGAVDVMSGDGLSQTQRAHFGATTFPAVALNYVLPDAKTLALGFATPFYVRAEIIYQTTWDRGVLSTLMREFPDQQSIWADRLAQLAFTHMLVNENMLRIWERAGWNDPVVTQARVMDFLNEQAALIHTYPDGTRLYELRLKGNMTSDEDR